MANPWIIAFRLKTLPAAVAPVLIGTAMACGHGVQDYTMALVALFGAVMIQIGTNLANDYFDFIKGADTPDRIGPTRVTQAGLIAPSDVRNVMILVFLLAALSSIVLILHAGWVIALIGVLSILSGVFYTAGPRPLGYMGLGELFVLVFFGPVAVGGTYYVQSLEINPAVVIAGFGPGLLRVRARTTISRAPMAWRMLHACAHGSVAPWPSCHPSDCSPWRARPRSRSGGT